MNKLISLNICNDSSCILWTPSGRILLPPNVGGLTIDLPETGGRTVTPTSPQSRRDEGPTEAHGGGPHGTQGPHESSAASLRQRAGRAVGRDGGRGPPALFPGPRPFIGTPAKVTYEWMGEQVSDHQWRDMVLRLVKAGSCWKAQRQQQKPPPSGDRWAAASPGTWAEHLPVTFAVGSAGRS